MSVSLAQLYQGKKFTIYEIKIDEISTLKDFTQSLTKDQIAVMIQLVQSIAENGTPSNPSRFKLEEDGIYAIKDVPHQVRIYCFFDRDRMILLTNGVIKKKRKADPNDLRRAKDLRQIYQNNRQEAGE